MSLLKRLLPGLLDLRGPPLQLSPQGVRLPPAQVELLLRLPQRSAQTMLLGFEVTALSLKIDTFLVELVVFLLEGVAEGTGVFKVDHQVQSLIGQREELFIFVSKLFVLVAKLINMLAGNF
jgi:hypothetical protein